MAIVPMFQRLTSNQGSMLFQAGATDVVVTLELKNTNSGQVKFKAELSDNDFVSLLGPAVVVKLGPNESYKKFNILVKAGRHLIVRATSPGLAAKVTKPAIYAIPGQVSLKNGESVQIAVHLDANGSHPLGFRGLPTGMTMDPPNGVLSEGNPVLFTLTRAATGNQVGQLRFELPSLHIGTVVDVGYASEVPPDDGSGEEPDFDVDLVASYISGRDHLS